MNATGSFPEFVRSVSYLPLIAESQREQFVASIVAKGGIYKGFNITARDANNKVIPFIPAPYYYPLLQVIPSSLGSLGTFFAFYLTV